MIARLSQMLSPENRRSDAGDVLMATLALMMTVALFTTFVISMAWAITMTSKKTQRATIAQEAVDVALAQAMFSLNEDFGVVSDDGTYVDADGAYNRTLPTADEPATADLTQFNATKQTSLHEVDTDTGQYGIQAQARWWVDLFPVSHLQAEASDPDRLRVADIVGELHVEARVANVDDSIVYGYRAVKMPLYQVQARAAVSASDDKGLSYIVSPLSLFQFSAFGTEGIEDLNPDGFVASLSPLASSADIVLDDPTDTFDLGDDEVRRYDAQMLLFGSGDCLDYDTLNAVTADEACLASRTMNTGFEVQPDLAMVAQIADYCGTNGLDDFIASEQENPSLIAGDATYCFRDFVMDDDVRLVTVGAGNPVVRIFVARDLVVEDGARFEDAAGSGLGVDPGVAATEPQAAVYTLSPSVTIEGKRNGSSSLSKMYLYAPNATCDLGQIPDDPTTSGTDESLRRTGLRFVGSAVCKKVVLDHTASLVNETPFAELAEFGAAGFGSDLYPDNLWFVNAESIEFVPRTEDAW